MIIKSLKLQNYRRFRNLDLEMPENLIGIAGNNGTGKTTIVEALGWVLYGNKIKRTDKQDIRSQFSDVKEPCIVELLFEIGGEEYRVVRQLRGKNATSEAAIYKSGNPEPEAVQESGVNDYVENLINLDYRSFFASVFARQKDLAALSALTPEERRKSIARLINIDAIEKARDRVRADRRIKSSTKEGMKSGIRDEKEMKAERKALKEQISAKLSREKEQRTALQSLQKELVSQKKKDEELSKLRDAYLELNSKIDKWESRKVDFEKSRRKQLEDIEKIKQAQSELKSLRVQLKDFDNIKLEKEKLDLESNKQASLNRLNKMKLSYSDDMAKKTAQMKKTEESLHALAEAKSSNEKINSEYEALEKKRETLRESISAVQAQLRKIESIGNDKKEHKANVEKLGADSPCPVCTRPLQDHYDTVITHFDEELDKLRTEYKKYQSEENDQQAKFKKLSDELKKMQSARDQLIRDVQRHQELEKRVSTLQEDAAGFTKQIKKIDAEIRDIGAVTYDEKRHNDLKKQFEKLTPLRDRALQYEERVKRLHNVEGDLKQSEATISELSAEIESNKKSLAGLNYDENKYREHRKALDLLQEKVDAHRDALARVEKEIAVMQKDIDKITADLDAQKKLVKEIERIEEEIHYLSVLEEHFTFFRQELAGRIRPVIAQRTSDLLSLTTNGRYSLLELDEDYNIYLYDQTQRFPLARFSGGEQDLANLCLRIAISQVVAERAGSTQVNFIVLDEIFGSQDEERKELILNTLQHLSSQFRQIFVITHVPEIKDVMPVVVSVEDVGGVESVARMV